MVDLVKLGLKVVHLFAQAAFVTDAFAKAAQDPDNLGIEGLGALFQTDAAGRGFARQADAFVVVRADVFGQYFGVLQALAQGVDDDSVDFVQPERVWIGAGLAVTVAGTDHADPAELVAAIGRHAAATGAAFQKAGQEAFRPLHGAGFPRLVVLPLYHLLHGIENLLIEDAQFLDLLGMLVFGAIEP